MDNDRGEAVIDCDCRILGGFDKCEKNEKLENIERLQKNIECVVEKVKGLIKLNLVAASLVFKRKQIKARNAKN